MKGNKLLRVLEPANCSEICQGKQLQYANKIIKYYYSHNGHSYEENENKFLVWNFLLHQIVFLITLNGFFYNRGSVTAI